MVRTMCRSKSTVTTSLDEETELYTMHHIETDDGVLVLLDSCEIVGAVFLARGGAQQAI